MDFLDIPTVQFVFWNGVILTSKVVTGMNPTNFLTQDSIQCILDLIKEVKP